MLRHSGHASKSTFRTIIGSTGQPVPDPLQYLIRVLGLASHLTRIFINQEVERKNELIEQAQADLSDFYTSLPLELRFETSSFRSYAAMSQGGAFVLLHVCHISHSNAFLMILDDEHSSGITLASSSLTNLRLPCPTRLLRIHHTPHLRVELFPRAQPRPYWTS